MNITDYFTLITNHFTIFKVIPFEIINFNFPYWMVEERFNGRLSDEPPT